MLLSQPIGTVVWGWMILGERMSAIQAGGIFLMTVGIAMLLMMGTVTSRK
jgi:drug/metabolite transporter (DMT)-like permease